MKTTKILHRWNNGTSLAKNGGGGSHQAEGGAFRHGKKTPLNNMPLFIQCSHQDPGPRGAGPSAGERCGCTGNRSAGCRSAPPRRGAGRGREWRGAARGCGGRGCRSCCQAGVGYPQLGDITGATHWIYEGVMDVGCGTDHMKEFDV